MNETCNNNPLNENEWDLIWMAMRYCMGRQTIASAMFPCMIMKSYYERMTPNQRGKLATDIERYLDSNDSVIGNKVIDHPIWMRFYNALKFDTIHYDVTVKFSHEEKTVSCFQVDGVFYPMENYLKNPSTLCYAPSELIVDIKTITKKEEV